MAKEKARRKAAILARQEEELAQRDAALSAAARDGSATQRASEGLSKENAALQVSTAPLISQGAFSAHSTRIQNSLPYLPSFGNHCQKSEIKRCCKSREAARRSARQNERVKLSPGRIMYFAGIIRIVIKNSIRI